MWFVATLVVVGADALPPQSAAVPPRPSDGWPLPLNWTDAWSNLAEFPRDTTSGAILVEPWEYDHRLSLYRTLVTATSAHAGASWWGGAPAADVLWGLPLQFGWQQSSGRLFPQPAAKPAPLGPVSETSWWACMNWMLSVIPFVGAVQSGVVFPNAVNESFLIEAPPLHDGNATRFCKTPALCQQKHPVLVGKWIDFYHIFAKGPPQSPASPGDLPGSHEDTLLGLLWDAHTESIHTGLALFEDEALRLPGPERNFGLGWANLVEFIAAARWPPDFNTTSLQQAQLLPPRILNSTDHPPFIKDMSSTVNDALLLIQALWDMNKKTSGDFVADWKRAMCSPAARVVGRALLNDLVAEIQHPREVIVRMMQIIADLPLPCANVSVSIL